MMRKWIVGPVVCLLVLLTSNAWALDYTYTVSGGKITITGYTGPGGDVVIPDTINGMPVVGIKNQAFGYKSSLISVTIPGSVTYIGSYAFMDCSNLTSAIIPDSVTSMGEFVFGDCSALTSVTLSNSITSIVRGTFDGCSALTSITIPGNVTGIGEFAFYGCRALTGITIPDSVTSIGGEVFTGCSALTSILVKAGNTVYSSQDGVLYKNNKTVLVAYPGGKSGGFVIPDSVTGIGDYCVLGLQRFDRHNHSRQRYQHRGTSVFLFAPL